MQARGTARARQEAGGADATIVAVADTPRALILRTAGTNCDVELAYAFELAGASAARVHLSRLVDKPGLLGEFDLIALPGGFSYGDDIAAGRIFANRLRHRLLDPLIEAIDRGVPVLGVCNGFQVLVKLGLLPLPDQPRQHATLADNTGGRFIDRWVRLECDADSPCIWTRGVHQVIDLPIAHGEGRLAAPPDVLQRIRADHLAPLLYAAGDNPNGSADDIAALCDPTGLVLGLMPHPERFTDPTHHPQWTRRGREHWDRVPDGLRLFRNAVEHVTREQTTAVGSR